jgi:elongation factor P
MLDATRLRKGMIIKREDGELWRVVEMQLITPGRWKAMVQTKLRKLKDNTVTDYRFRSEERVEQAFFDEIPVEFLYQSGDDYFFMNHETFDQITLNGDIIGDGAKYLMPNIIYTIESYQGKPVNVVPPITLELKVVDTEPNIKGATASASYKPATLENGMVVNVPPFIKPGDVVKIDTRDDKYLERA